MPATRPLYKAGGMHEGCRLPMNLLIDLLLAVYVAVSLLLVLVVLMQRPRSEGLGTAFASGMVEQYIGPATNVLVRFTTWMGSAFFILSILLAILYSHRSTAHSKIGERLRSVPAVKAAATPKPAPAASIAPAAPAGSPILAPSPAAALSPAPAASLPAAPAISVPSSPAPSPVSAVTPAVPVTPLLAPPPSPAASPTAR
jgi:preprotein translocase subunit SecG